MLAKRLSHFQNCFILKYVPKSLWSFHYPLSFLLADQPGSSEMFTVGQNPSLCRTCTLNPSRAIFELPPLGAMSEENGHHVDMVYWKSSEKAKTPSSYHDGVDKSHNVYGPDGAEAGKHGQQEVVFNFGPVQGRVGGDAWVAGKRRPGRKGGVADGARPAPLPGLAMMMGVRDGVLSSGGRGDHRRGALRRHRVDPVTYTWGDEKDGANV